MSALNHTFAPRIPPCPNEPPFMRFWSSVNEARAVMGLPEVTMREATWKFKEACRDWGNGRVVEL